MQIPSYVAYSLAAAVAYGFAGPLQAQTMARGTTPWGTQLFYGLGIASISLFGIGKPFFGTAAANYYGIAFGLCGGIAMYLVSSAFNHHGSATTIAFVVGLCPVATALIEHLIFQKKVLWKYYIPALAFFLLALKLTIMSQQVEENPVKTENLVAAN